MKALRPILLALILVAVFLYFTTLRPGHPRASEWFSRPTKVEITEASAGDSLDGEEQNNIAVYKNNIPAVVNITSRAMTFDFFYGEVPQEGQGSGFIMIKTDTSSPTIMSSPKRGRWKSPCTIAKNTGLRLSVLTPHTILR